MRETPKTVFKLSSEAQRRREHLQILDLCSRVRRESPGSKEAFGLVVELLQRYDPLPPNLDAVCLDAIEDALRYVVLGVGRAGLGDLSVGAAEPP